MVKNVKIADFSNARRPVQVAGPAVLISKFFRKDLRPKEATLSSRPLLYRQYLTLIIAKIDVCPAARREKTAGTGI